MDYQLVYSVDGEEYTKVKEYRVQGPGMDKIKEDLSGIEARYVRLKNLKEVPVWLKFSGIKVDTLGGTSKFTYTNNDDYKTIKAQHTLEETSLNKTEDRSEERRVGKE